MKTPTREAKLRQLRKLAINHATVTTYGVKNGKYSGMINSQVTMDDLFVE